LSGSEQTQAIEEKIDALADPHAGVTDEQERVTSDIVAAQEFLLDKAILFGSQWSWETGVGMENSRQDRTGGPKRANRGAMPIPPSGGAKR
jgi:hypothetical protein